ncbi:MAG: exodeoxyribonuclease VII small subunit [Candidatus Eisenbacteria bacterium]|uniref:Exodeoxyribonuclease 7 small subunit n=1 Tax=Eiseniibacteriota bacterium TaxID=2212470 RepID=A0A9D6QKM8_UNCEI|nr:exodeoxyribonuclease VII small subunit [Candidatus Eisenbacteria bacterium]MBI3540366.1 exodeoxyribonuclease VII small subunit [Candidatus Eisenbacteria bacterium]
MPASKRGAAASNAGDAEPPFEQALERLETIVEELEAGSLTLEESLARYEEGVRLSRRLTASLDQAEQRIERLVEEQGQPPATRPLELDNERNDRDSGSGEGELPF